MAKRSITEILLENYSKKIVENSKKITLEDAKTLPGYKCYRYEDLPDTLVDGFPIGSDFIDDFGNIFDMNSHQNLNLDNQKNCTLRYHYLPLMHELYIGTTGSGKTTGCVEPQLRAISNQKNKPNIFITDPKGEIFNHNAEFLIERGYKVFVLNFKDVSRSDRWNPLDDMYTCYMRLAKYKKGPKLMMGEPDSSLNLTNYVKRLDNEYYLHDGMAFGSFDDYAKYASLQKDIIISETDSLIRQFATIFCPVTSKQDTSWELGCQQTCQGIIQLMLELALENPKTFTRDMFTIKTIFDFYNTLAREMLEEDYANVANHRLIKGHKRVAEQIGVTFSNAPRTMRSYIGVFQAQTNSWQQGHIFALTTGNNIEIENLEDPFAIFVITRDYEKSDFTIAGLFIDSIYKKLIIQAEENERKGIKQRPTHFLLDEFGNIPKIENFENKIATSRSRNVWMHLFLQSYEQIDNVYGAEASAIIQSNCNSQIYLGSQSVPTIEKFSNACGYHHALSINPDLTLSTDFRQSLVLKRSDLDLIDVGSMYIKRLYTPVMYSHYIRSYYLKDTDFYKIFKNDGLLKCTPNNFEGYSGDKYTYSGLEKPLDKYSNLKF